MNMSMIMMTVTFIMLLTIIANGYTFLYASEMISWQQQSTTENGQVLSTQYRTEMPASTTALVCQRNARATPVCLAGRTTLHTHSKLNARGRWHASAEGSQARTMFDNLLVVKK